MGMMEEERGCGAPATAVGHALPPRIYSRLALTDVRQTYSKLLATVRRVSYGGVAGNGCLRTTYSYPAELGQGSGAYLLYFYPRYLKYGT